MIRIYAFLQSNDLYLRFDSIRRKKGLSLYAIAKNSGCTSESLYKWRDRKTTPSLYLIECICAALEIEMAELLYEDPVYIAREDIDKELIQQIKNLRGKDKENLLSYIHDNIENKNDG